MTKNKPLHHFVVSEVLQFFTLVGREEYQLHIAEQIASNHYYFIDDIVDVVMEYASARFFKKDLAALKACPGFKKYWRADGKN